jgi:hypothetical protein
LSINVLFFLFRSSKVVHLHNYYLFPISIRYYTRTNSGQIEHLASTINYLIILQHCTNGEGCRLIMQRPLQLSHAPLRSAPRTTLTFPSPPNAAASTYVGLSPDPQMCPSSAELERVGDLVEVQLISCLNFHARQVPRFIK